MTAQNLIDTFLRTYRHCDAPRALDILNEVDEEILMVVPLRQAAVDVVLTADALTPSELVISETVLKVFSVWYWESATSRYPLEETSVDHLDVYDPSWRTQTVSQPIQFYISQNGTTQLLGLVPGTKTATAAGYPKVTMYCTQRTVLAANTVLPLTPQIRRLYVSGMRYVYALERKVGDAAGYKKIFDDDLAKQAEATMTRPARLQPEIQLVKQRPNWRRCGVRRDSW